MYLKSTEQKVYPLPWTATVPAPWPDGYTRITIPYSKREILQSRNNKRMHVQVVHNDNLLSKL